MPTRTLPTLALSALLLLAACSPSAPVTDEAQGETMMMSMRDLAKLGMNYTCTFADTDEGGNTTEGTVYVEGETNFRGEFAMMQDGRMMHSTIIRAGNKTYMWSVEQPGGIMMTMEEEDESLFGMSDTDTDESFDEDEPMEMRCRSWPPNRNMFDPPRDREFTDLKSQMEMMMDSTLRQSSGQAGSPQGQGMPKMDGSACSACDEAPDAATKAQCRQALGC